jgi:hypothetical protein
MPNAKHICLSVLMAAGLAALPSQAAAQEKPPARGIVKITGELYRAQNDNHYTVFLVTPQGIILSDPINRDFSRWLKGEIDTRFKQPVRYVVYSHSHWDHAAGGAVFESTATFVAHENMRRNMDGRYPHMPGDMWDRNDNGVIDPEEISIPTNAWPGICGLGPNSFGQMDRNRDGRISPQELHADTLAITSDLEAASLCRRAVIMPREIDEFLAPIPYIIPGQLFAALLAEAKGLDPDAPRSLSKVTRTL